MRVTWPPDTPSWSRVFLAFAGKSCDRSISREHKEGRKKHKRTENRRLFYLIQTSGILHISKPKNFTLNRHLFTDETDVCFSAKMHYILAGSNSDVWTREVQTSVSCYCCFWGFWPRHSIGKVSPTFPGSYLMFTLLLIIECSFWWIFMHPFLWSFCYGFSCRPFCRSNLVFITSIYKKGFIL